MFDEDLDLFFDGEDTAVEVMLDARKVYGVLSNSYIESDFIESTSPTFTFKSSDAPDVAHGSVLVASKQKYTVTNVLPDGTGVTLLELRETA